MVRKSILILAIILSIGVGLVGGYVFWGRGHYIFPPPPGIPEQIEPKATVVFEDSFILSVSYKYMSGQELQEWLAWQEEMEEHPKELWEIEPLPFNRFGMYYNRVFLQKNEVVEVVMRSPETLTVVDVGGDPPMTFLIEIGSDSDSRPCVPPSTLSRVNGNWELTFTFKAESDGYYSFTIYNNTLDLTWCQYAVILRN